MYTNTRSYKDVCNRLALILNTADNLVNMSHVPPRSKRTRSSSLIVSDPELGEGEYPAKRHLSEFMASAVESTLVLHRHMSMVSHSSEDISTSEGPSTTRTPTPPLPSGIRHTPGHSYGLPSRGLGSHHGITSADQNLLAHEDGTDGDVMVPTRTLSMHMSDSGGALSQEITQDTDPLRRVSSGAVHMTSQLPCQPFHSSTTLRGAAQTAVWQGTLPPHPQTGMGTATGAGAGTGTGTGMAGVALDGQQVRDASGVLLPLGAPLPPHMPLTWPLASRRISDSLFRSLGSGLMIPNAYGPAIMPGASALSPGPGMPATAQPCKSRPPSQRSPSLSQSQMQELMPPSPSDARFTFADLRKTALLRSLMQRTEDNANQMVTDTTDTPLPGGDTGLSAVHTASGMDMHGPGDVQMAPPRTLSASSVCVAGLAEELEPLSSAVPHGMARTHPSSTRPSQLDSTSFPVQQMSTESRGLLQNHGLGYVLHPISPPMSSQQPSKLGMPQSTPFVLLQQPPGHYHSHNHNHNHNHNHLLGGTAMRPRGTSPMTRSESWMDAACSLNSHGDSSSGSGEEEEVEQQMRRSQPVRLGAGGVAHLSQPFMGFANTITAGQAVAGLGLSQPEMLAGTIAGVSYSALPASFIMRSGSSSGLRLVPIPEGPHGSSI